MVYGSVNTLLFIAWNFETTSAPRERETFGYLFCPHMPYGSRVSLIGEEEEEEEKKKIHFFRFRFLGLYKAEQKSEDIFVLRRVRAFHRYPFC